MGLRQDPNRRLSAAPSVRFAATQRHRTRKHSNDKRTLVTHTLDDGRSSWAGDDALRHRLGSDCQRRARREDLGRQYQLGRGDGYDASMPAAPPRPAPTRFGRQRYRTIVVARRSAEDLAPFRALENAAHDATQGHSGRSTE